MRIVDAGFVKSMTGADRKKEMRLPEVCFVGRSNVGKSSLLNTLAARKIARVGSTPGATRLINLYNVRCEWEGRKKEIIFSDFPGFGYSKVSKGVYQNWQTMVEGYMEGNEWIRRVLWAFDIRRDFDDLDEMLLDWLNAHNFAFSFVLTKADKEGKGRALEARRAFQQRFGAEAFLFSSKDGLGRKELLIHIARSLG